MHCFWSSGIRDSSMEASVSTSKSISDSVGNAFATLMQVKKYMSFSLSLSLENAKYKFSKIYLPKQMKVRCTKPRRASFSVENRMWFNWKSLIELTIDEWHCETSMNSFRYWRQNLYELDLFTKFNYETETLFIVLIESLMITIQ